MVLLDNSLQGKEEVVGNKRTQEKIKDREEHQTQRAPLKYP